LAGERGLCAGCPSGCQNYSTHWASQEKYRSYSSHISFTSSIEVPAAGLAITLQLTDSNISSNNALACASLRSAMLILTSTGALNRLVSNQYSMSCFCCCIRYERGETKPNAEAMSKLAKVLDTTVDFLMSGTTDDLVMEAGLDKELVSRFKEVQDLPAEERRTVLSLLDAFIAKTKIQGLLQNK